MKAYKERKKTLITDGCMISGVIVSENCKQNEIIGEKKRLSKVES